MRYEGKGGEVQSLGLQQSQVRSLLLELRGSLCKQPAAMSALPLLLLIYCPTLAARYLYFRPC